MNMAEELSKIVHILPSIGTTSYHLTTQMMVLQGGFHENTGVFWQFDPKGQRPKKAKGISEGRGQRGQIRQLGVCLLN